jgi:hypothetical protein
MTDVAFDWVETHVLSVASPSSPPFTHTGDTNWTPVTGATTGSITLEAATNYRIVLSVQLKTSSAVQRARARVYDVTGAAVIVGCSTIETVDGEWRLVAEIVAPGAGAREYRMEAKIDNGAQTVTITSGSLTVEHL